jgi:transposase
MLSFFPMDLTAWEVWLGITYRLGDAAGQVVLRRQLRRRHVLAFFQKLPPCLVGIEACASRHHWSRELQALGHTVLPK